MHLLPQSQGPTHVFSTLAMNSGISVAVRGLRFRGLVFAFMSLSLQSRKCSQTQSIWASSTALAPIMPTRLATKRSMVFDWPITVPSISSNGRRPRFVEFACCFGGVELRPLHGAEVSGVPR